MLDWPAKSVVPETCVRFPWRGGTHPHHDAVIRTEAALVGIESKRYEPFRDTHKVDFSPAYGKQDWGSDMHGWEAVRDALGFGEVCYRFLDACQLVKHAFGLWSERKRSKGKVRQIVLYYLYAEPLRLINGKRISEDEISAHRAEIADFGARVAGDDVAFFSCSYPEFDAAMD